MPSRMLIFVVIMLLNTALYFITYVGIFESLRFVMEIPRSRGWSLTVIFYAIFTIPGFLAFLPMIRKNTSHWSLWFLSISIISTPLFLQITERSLLDIHPLRGWLLFACAVISTLISVGFLRMVLNYRFANK